MVNDTLKAQVRELFLVHEDELVEGISDELASELIANGLLTDKGDEYENAFYLTKEGIEVGLDHERVIQQAKERLVFFGLDTDKYDWIDNQDGHWWFNRQVIATLKTDADAHIMLSAIWVNAKGDILQAGSNYGTLTL